MSVEQAKVDQIYHHFWDNSDAVAAREMLDQVGDVCAQEEYLQALAKNAVSLFLGTKAQNNKRSVDTLWVRFNGTALPGLILEDVPKSCGSDRR